jgi:hypothetical protein
MVIEQIRPTPITTEMLEQAASLTKIFMPYAEKQRLDLFKKTPDQKSAQLVHYTTAEAALNIIRSKRFRMRNTNFLLNFRRASQGRACSRPLRLIIAVWSVQLRKCRILAFAEAAR